MKKVILAGFYITLTLAMVALIVTLGLQFMNQPSTALLITGIFFILTGVFGGAYAFIKLQEVLE